MLDIGFSILASNFATRDVLADCGIDTGTTRVVLTLQDLQKTRFEQTKPYAGPWPSGTGMGRTKTIDDLVNADLGHARLSQRRNSYFRLAPAIKQFLVAPASLFLLFSLMFSGTGVAQPSVVVIDPGHGGHDRGGIPGQRLAEKVFTLDTAKRLARVLSNRTAIKVVLTRSDDRFVSLEERTNIANQYAGRNALFVSIHFNAGLREGAYGIETYYNNQRGYRLATLVHPRVIQAMASADRGIRHRGYRVLRKNRLPAILVECGFLTNPVEAARITDAHSRERLARAIADAILLYD